MRNFNQKETLNLLLLSVAKETLPSRLELLTGVSLYIGNILGVCWALFGGMNPFIGACNFIALVALSFSFRNVYMNYCKYKTYKMWLQNELEHGWLSPKPEADTQNLDQDKT